MIKNKNKTNDSKKNTISFTEKPVEMTKDTESQTVKVKGTRRMLASKSKTATWY
jgi:hypothetical protein|tara:strand:+ start:925 stop:1086 length:162 start_codon:yes stop_codon:yes gene_type:complete